MSADSAPDDWLSYRDCVPLRWQRLEVAIPAWQLERHGEQNLRMLAAVAAVEERHAPPESEGEVALEIARLHRKLDLVLDLVGTLLRVQSSAPEPQPLRISRQGLAWSDGPAPADGEHGLVHLYLHPAVPQPFVWPATALAGAETRVVFDPMPESCQALLERHVFTRHRRSVAESRQPGGR